MSKQYSPHICRWVKYCEENHLDPFNADVSAGANFLTQYFHVTTVEYSALNTARSALSAVIKPVNGLTFGNHPMIKRLLKGMFREDPV